MRNDSHRSLAIADAQLPAPLRQSDHARLRAAQRNLSAVAEAYVMAWGRVFYRTGVLFYFLGEKDIPAQHRRMPEIMRLAGAVVLTSRDGEIITTYRRADASRVIQRKMKYRLTPGWPGVTASDVADAPETD